MPPKQKKFSNIKEDNSSKTVSGIWYTNTDSGIPRSDNSITASNNSLSRTLALSTEQNRATEILKDILKNNNYRGESHPLVTDSPPYHKPSFKIIKCATTDFRNNDLILEDFKASYLLTSLGTALLRLEFVNNKLKEIQDPLAFKIQTLQKKLLEKELTYNFLSQELNKQKLNESESSEANSSDSEDSDSSSLKNLQKQYDTELNALRGEYQKVNELSQEKKNLHDIYRNSFPYIPKKLSHSFIEKYNSIFKVKNYSADEVTQELRCFRAELTKLEKFNNLFRNKDGQIERLQKNITEHLDLINTDIALSKISGYQENKCTLTSLLVPKVRFKDFLDKINNPSIQAAQKIFDLEDVAGTQLLRKIKDKVKEHSNKIANFIKDYNEIFPENEKDMNEIKLHLERFSSKPFYSKIKQMANLFDCNNNEFKTVLEKVENLVGKTPPNDYNINNILDSKNIAKLREHLTNSYKYTIDPEYLESLNQEDFLVQVRAYKQLGRNMIKNILLLSASGCETIKINIPPGINTTLEIFPTGSTKYFLGELGAYNKISMLNLCTLKNYQSFICKDLDSKEKENEFKLLSQIEAIRNCSALLTNPMFFELARAGFVQYKSEKSQEPYNFDKIATQMPMAMGGAVSGSVYLEQQFSKFLKENQLCYDYRGEGKEKNGRILADRDSKILFDWLCYELGRTEKIFYTEFKKNTNIQATFAQQGWSYGNEKNRTKSSKETQNEYELTTEEVMIDDKRVLVTISDIQRFPLKIFDSLITNWYGNDIITNNDTILIGDLKVTEFNVDTCDEE